MHGLQIDFDYDSTKKYRLEYESQCDCAYCWNYYKTFRAKYLETTKLLEEFGLDIVFPLEIMPLQYDELKNEKEYISFYPVKGTIDQDEIRVDLEGLIISIFKGSESTNPCPSPKMDDPYLLIGVYGIKLPWVIDENPD